uniref:Uncharacterized protein n=1 Tax=Geospiza parvula TaxID=87175 RepID=A0A8C3N8Q0_GEOPR
MLGYMEKINDGEGHPSSSHQALKGTSKWATSLENLLEDPEGVKRFREFLKKEFSEENVLFWLACEEFKKTQGKKQMQEKAKEIYMTFLSSKASSQVNVEGQSRLSETILETPHPLMFQKLQDQVKLFISTAQFHSFLCGFGELCFLAMTEQVSTELCCLCWGYKCSCSEIFQVLAPISLQPIN